MGVPMIKRCCCTNLHTGTVIIAYLYTIWALLELAVCALMITLKPLGQGNVTVHKLVLYSTASVISGIHLLCSLLLIVAAYKKLPWLTLPWTILTGILTAIYFIVSLTGISLILQDTGTMLEVEVIIISMYFIRACVSVYNIMVVHSRHKEMMQEEDEERFQHSARLYHAVKVEDHPL